MPLITRDSLLTLEGYAKVRPEMRAEVMAHKKNRMVELGDHVTLIFEDEKTMRYQIQEMLRAERTFEEAGIQDELDAYNPLVPDGTNWKATMLIEYPEESERRAWLARLIGVEDRVWVRVAGFEPVFAIADEDLEREKQRWQDPAYVRAQARERFGYLMPGEKSYVVLDKDGKPIESQASLSDPHEVLRKDPQAWWSKEWESVKLAGNPSAAR